MTSLERIRPVLEARLAEAKGPVVVMTCGIAGAGKSTLAKAIVEAYPSFTRLSIDAIIAAHHGLYGVDYPPSAYAAHQASATAEFAATAAALLRAGDRNLVLDRSFYARRDRDACKAAVEEAGGRWVLVYLRAGRDLLWRRVRERRARGVDADSALDISEELLDRYVAGFEEPVGEGEVVVDVE